jgi:hypothetical protein
VVFALNVLEHLDDRQVAEFADWVCRARPRIVVVSMPREARANRIFNFLTQHEFVNGIEHINEWKNVGRILMKRLELVGYKRIFLMQWASAWKVKG